MFARRNGTCMPDRPLADMPPVDISKRLTLGTALRDWHIARRFLVLSYTWMVLGMAYYVSQQSSNIHAGYYIQGLLCQPFSVVGWSH